jgi:hypothetical protein
LQTKVVWNKVPEIDVWASNRRSESGADMESKTKKVHLTDRMVLIALGLGIVYWLIETFFYFVMSYEIDIWARLFGPNLAGVCTRVVVLCLFLIFGSHAQQAFNQRKQAEAELAEMKALNAKLEQELAELKSE